jgi:hypothetical protein
VALRAVADDGHFLRFNEGEVCVFSVVILSHDVEFRSFAVDVDSLRLTSRLRPRGDSGRHPGNHRVRPDPIFGFPRRCSSQ